MKILLIDDKANKGWRQLLEKLFPIQGIEVVSAINVKQAKEKLKDKYDIIFLDVRLERDDHNHREVKNYSGFKVLEFIKNNFLNINFSTPIILFTASNKIWSIQEFLNYGVDAFYIKEHPDNVFDKDLSNLNFKVLKEDFNSLLTLSPKRADIWEKSSGIIKAVESHHYFNSEKCYINVRDRIVDKIKLGYYYSFKKPNSLEEETLKVDNESFAYLIYFSILEEIIKGYTDKNTWNTIGEFSGNWKFRNDNFFLKIDGNYIIVEPFRDKQSKDYIKKAFALDHRNYINGHVNLSEQVQALLFHYGMDGFLSERFKRLNHFRNKLSYTHSSIADIYTKSLVDNKTSGDTFPNNLLMLDLILKILDYK